MYNLIRIKKDILGFHFGEKYIVCINKENNGKIEIKNYFNEILFLSNQKWVNQFSLVGDILIYSSYDEDFTRIYNLYSKEDIILDVYFYGVQLYSPYIYNYLYYNLSEYDNNFVYDLHTGEVVEKCLKNIKGEIKLNTNSHIVTQKDAYIYIYIKNDFSLLWQKDLSEIASYTDWDGSQKQGEIREIYSYNNTLIVLTQLFILRINLQTGEIIYSLRLPAGLMTLSIEGDKAYGCYGYHYMEIDLEKGELINFVRIENALLNGKEYNAIMNRASYKDGFVFHGLRLEGGQYAVGAINTNRKCFIKWQGVQRYYE